MIGILTAMESEAREIFARMRVANSVPWGFSEVRIGTLSDRDICVARSGVGKVMAAAMTTHMVEAFDLDAIVYIGIAGALSLDLNIGDLVLGTECLQHDLDATLFGFGRGELPYDGIRWLGADQELLRAGERYQPETGRIIAGRIVTGDQFCSFESRSRMPYLIDELDAIAVDMEGAASALVAHVSDVPFLHARIISDKADGSAKIDFQRFLPVAAGQIADFLEHLLIAYRA